MKTKAIIHLIQGSVMGVAEIIPGVSGSTFALAMGIYDNFIAFLHELSDVAKYIALFFLGRKKLEDVRSTFKKVSFRFGLPLIVGMLLSILLLARLINYLFENYEQYLLSLFFGMVLASFVIPVLAMDKYKLNHFGIGLLALILTFLLVGIQPVSLSEVPPIWYVFIGGIVGISGLLLPGISGSFILLLLGLYRYIVQSVENLSNFTITTEEFLRLVVFSLGIITGFIFFVRVIMYFYNNYRNSLLAVLSGIILGSLRVIYPFFEYSESGDPIILSPFDSSQEYNVFLLLVIILVGVIFVAFISRFGKAKQDLL
jgi:putative membrane protein